MQLDYARQAGAADIAILRACHVVLDRECRSIDPAVHIVPVMADFVSLPDVDLKRIMRDATLLIMSTDHHPAQARGALAGLVCDVPVLLASIYRRGRAGEIIYTYPGQTRACYRCITRERYEYVARQRTSGTGDAVGSLPFAAAIVDAIVGHLAVGILHKRHGAENPYAHWIDELGQRNFIQTRMDPHYRLDGEDLFGDVLGRHEKIFAFDTIWQPGEVDTDCPDCHGHGAFSLGDRVAESTEIHQLPCGCLVQSTPGARECPACARSLTMC
jgi:hypothetical protein